MAMSLLAELKRRNVFRVGIAYAVVSWLLLQVIATVVPILDLPEWVAKLTLLALALGFIPTVIFAWAFELTPEGVKKESEVDRTQSISPQTGRKLDRIIIAFLVIALGYFAWDKFGAANKDSEPLVGGRSAAELPTEGIAVRNVTTENSIAVLPFVNMSPDPDQEYFSDGISEEILNMLVRLPALKVAGRTSSFSFKGHDADLREIGEKLGVSHILEGSVRKSGDRVRITAQLIKATDGFHLWSQTYDRELTDIFAVQDEIATAIADALAVQLALPGGSQLPAFSTTQNIEAYERFLQGRGLLAQRLDFPRAIQLLGEANALDPDFAPAWAANAQAHALSIYYHQDVHQLAVLNEAEGLALRALELDPDLAAAHSVLGDIYRDRSEWMKARQSYLRALELSPDDAETNVQFAQTLWRAGFVREALSYSAKAADLDPLSWINLTVNGAILYILGEKPRAWAVMDRGMAISGGARQFQLTQAIRMALSDGDSRKAIEWTHKFGQTQRMKALPVEYKEMVERLASSLDQPDKALALMREQGRLSSPEARRLLWEIRMSWAVYFGDLELARSISKNGAAQNDKQGVIDTIFAWYPLFGQFRSTDSFKQVMRELRLDEFWRAYQHPDFCQPLGEDDFECR